MKKILIALLLLMFIPSVVYAACVANGEDWTFNTDSPATAAAMQTCINNADPGDTISVVAGTYTWSTQITITKSIYLIGAGIDLSIITAVYTDTAIAITINPTDNSDNVPVRISGFTFNSSTGGDNDNYLFYYRNTSNVYPSSKVRIDHCKFTHSGTGSSRYTIVLAGLAHGLLDNCVSSYWFAGLGGNYSLWAGNSQYCAFEYGNRYNFYFEDNVWSGYAMFDGNAHGRYAVRYNTYNPTIYQGFFDQHGDHGLDYAGMGAEIYGNQFNAAPAGTNGVAQGRSGRWLLFYNNFTGSGYGDNWLMWYREDEQDSTFPPAIQAYNGQTHHINNSYTWGNFRNGSLYNTASIVQCYNGTNCLTCSTCNEYVVTENLHWWKHNNSFDGVNGIGLGAVGSRPATCSPTTLGSTYGGKEAQRESTTGQIRGPGYWETSQSTTDLTGLVGASTDVTGGTRSPSSYIQGTLYKCTATNTWTAYYTPLAYPHPLRGEAAIPPSMQGCTISGGTFK